ncbi:MAM domain-containing protein 2a [Erpetoichthys calabaricus]|uniref:MAM domain-containing protein 2a n=1 Tax=Erpetoichthys calabaricus TaxID=27687 RepID=UPI002234C926|nr:MAM domain-containing protein 2a [Erpetoichthys calabaricus]
MLPFLVIILPVLLPLRAQQLLQGSCTFEGSTCGYSSDPAHLKWSLNTEGHYITVDSTKEVTEKRAVLISPILEFLDWSCVRIVYQISGSGTLQMYIRPEGESFDYRLWSSQDTSDSWLIATVDLRNTLNQYKIIFEGTPGEDLSHSVAIFEIRIVQGYCIECNFEEHHICGYTNVWNPNVNWYVGGYISRDPLSSLLDDHTMSNQRGHYMYVDSIYVKNFQEVAQLASPMTMFPIAGCLSFYYHRNQGKGNIFSVFTRDVFGHYEEIWRPEKQETSTWNRVKVDIKTHHPLQVVFEVAFSSAKGGSIAVDDISFSADFCNTETEPFFDPSIANCDFEEDFCRYYQESSEGSMWRRVSINPNVYRIGDHTKGSGSFLLANTRYSSRPGYVARLYGPFLQENVKYCLKFFYALYGFIKTENTLIVYIYDENSVALEKVWNVPESSRGSWIRVEISFHKPMPTKVVFVSICRNFWDCGLVALDDISVTHGDCHITAGIHHSPAGECNFDKNECEYTQDEKDKGQWIRKRGQTPTSYTGPKGDHTTGVGYYMYIEASHMFTGHNARLLSSNLRGFLHQQCLTFFYSMYGSGTGMLSVYLKKNEDKREILLWRRRGEQSISWLKGSVEYECEQNHQIVFEAIRGISIRSDIAIDDIVMKKGPCKELKETSFDHSGFSENFNVIDY